MGNRKEDEEIPDEMWMWMVVAVTLLEGIPCNKVGRDERGSYLQQARASGVLTVGGAERRRPRPIDWLTDDDEHEDGNGRRRGADIDGDDGAEAQAGIAWFRGFYTILYTFGAHLSINVNLGVLGAKR